MIPPLLLPRLGQIYREAETVGCVRKACFLLMKSVLIGQRISIYVEAKPKSFQIFTGFVGSSGTLVNVIIL